MLLPRTAGKGAAPSGFTLLEILTVLVVIGILIVLLMPAFAAVQARAARANCVNNLRGLYTGANLYLQERQHWPQIKAKSIRDPQYALDWVAALSPYQIAHKNWICTTVQRQLRSPDYTKGESARIDYYGTPFDTKPQTPFKWSAQPWFIERGDVHGDGQLLIFADGQITSLQDVVKHPKTQTVEW